MVSDRFRRKPFQYPKPISVNTHLVNSSTVFPRLVIGAKPEGYQFPVGLPWTDRFLTIQTPSGATAMIQ